MGRFSTDLDPDVPETSEVSNTIDFAKHKHDAPQSIHIDSLRGDVDKWPTFFEKPVVGLDLNGVIVEDIPLTGPDQVKVLPTALEAIKKIRLKGYKLQIIADQPLISKKIITQHNVDESFNHLMSIFGQAGIRTIDGFYYNTSNTKQDMFSKPNVGMFKRAFNESNGQIDYSKGWYVGDSIEDLKMAVKAGAKPILIETGNYKKTLQFIKRNSNRKVRQKTMIFPSLLEFAEHLP